MSDKALALRAVSHRFGAVEVLDSIDLEVGRGEFVALVGPSGCGKSTLLNLVSGFDPPAAGQLTRSGNARMVYQENGLFPWLTVSQNVELGLMDGRSVQQMIRLVHLDGFENHYPHELSGGMRQRAELARVLAGDADILLMDEPFSALDYLTRIRMRLELSELLSVRAETRPVSVLLVTHDLEEAAQLADRIIVLSDRPARIREELRIDLPRPRAATDPRVVEAVERMLKINEVNA